MNARASALHKQLCNVTLPALNAILAPEPFMPLIRTRSDIDTKLGGPTPAEEKLLAACIEGESCILGETVPQWGRPDPSVHVRAAVLRYLITGGCQDHPVADWGIELHGAYVTGTLDLKLARARGVTGLITCYFEAPIAAFQARLQMLNFLGSVFPQLDAQGANIMGSVFLRRVVAGGPVNFASATILGQLDCEDARFDATNSSGLNLQGATISDSALLRGIYARSEVKFHGATIGGLLNCSGAHFGANEGLALNAQGASIAGNVILERSFASAQVMFARASIGGQFSCLGAIFKATVGPALNTESAQITRGVDLRQLTANAEVRLAGAEIGGQLVCDDASFKASEAIALNAQGVRVSDGIYFRRVTSGGGTISFADSYIRTIVDDLHSWPPQGQLIFEGLTYDSMLNSDFPVVTDRLDWLAKGSNWNGEFFPQPYTQLAKVYLLMGHDSEARAVLFERERLLMRQRFNTHWTLHNGDPNTGVPMTNTNYHTMLWSFLLRFAVGYGY